MAEEFTTEVDLPAPVEEVFRHLTEPAAMIRWMGQHATLTPVPGGAFEVDINGVPVRGRYLEIDPPRRVLVSWGVAGNTEMPPGATEVEFTLTPTPQGTRLRLVHRGLVPGQEEIHAAWLAALPQQAQSSIRVSKRVSSARSAGASGASSSSWTSASTRSRRSRRAAPSRSS